MYKVVEASESHSKDITDFQIKMAMETENLELDPALVSDAVIFLNSNNMHGQFYVSVEIQTNQTCGSLLATVENEKSWWIQSVYVKPDHRRKGIFSSIFKNLVKTASEKGVKSLKLYAEKQNEKAKQTYKKLGMYCNGQLFYGSDLVYGPSEQIERLKLPYPENTIVEKSDKKYECEGFFKIGKSNQLNRGLICRNGEQIYGSCQYFSEFSEWRFGITFYISFLQMNESRGKEVVESFSKFLYENSDLKVGAIRFLVNNEDFTRLHKIYPSLHLQPYDVMAIDL